MINKIKGLKKFTDCSMPSNEIECKNKAEITGYNQAIEDAVKLIQLYKEEIQTTRLFCNNCGNKLLEKEIYFGTCLQCDSPV